MDHNKKEQKMYRIGDKVRATNERTGEKLTGEVVKAYLDCVRIETRLGKYYVYYGDGRDWQIKLLEPAPEIKPIFYSTIRKGPEKYYWIPLKARTRISAKREATREYKDLPGITILLSQDYGKYDYYNRRIFARKHNVPGAKWQNA